jgi:hypothetical protein
MSESIRWIVNSHVKLKRRESLEELREHRKKLKRQLHGLMSKGGFDPSDAIRFCDDDLSVIEQGLARL